MIVALFRELTDITHHIQRTRRTGDGGFDFFGTFILPHPIKYEVKFRGEVDLLPKKLVQPFCRTQDQRREKELDIMP